MVREVVSATASTLILAVVGIAAVLAAAVSIRSAQHEIAE